MLTYTAEIRWFFEGALSGGVEDWFCHGLCSEAETRTDSYVRLPGCETVGIKLREKNFEVKALTHAGRHAAIDASAGLREGWVKWSFSDPAVTPFADAMRDGVPLLAVDKKRRLRKYACDSGTPQPIAPAAQPAEGCNAELTSLMLEGRPWWTIGFEAFGSSGTIEHSLLATLRRFLGDGTGPLRFETANSYSYPAWLARFGGG